MQHHLRKCSLRADRATGDHPTDDTMEAYALGHLDEAQNRSFYGHLSDCRACRTRLRAIIDTIKTIRDVLVLAELSREDAQPTDLGGSNTSSTGT